MSRYRPIAVLLGVLVVSAVAHGQAPAVPKGVSGYTVKVQDSWVMSDKGLYPIRVTVETNPPKNVVNDTLFTVSINHRNYQFASGVVSTPLIIPAGKKSGSVELYVCAEYSIYASSIEILVEKGEYDGQFNRQDLLKTSLPPRGSYGLESTLLFVSTGFTQKAERGWTCYPGTMQPYVVATNKFVSSDPIPRIDELSALYQQPGRSPNTGNRQTKKARAATPPEMVIANSERIHGIHPDELPGSWIGLSAVDQILISMSDFKSLSLKQDAARGRIEQWVSAGGILIVFDTGPGFKEADKIWPFLLGADRAPAGDRKLSPWVVPDSKTEALRQLLPRPNSKNPYYYDQDQAIWYDSEGRETVELNLDAKRWVEYAKPSLIPTAEMPVNGNDAKTSAAKKSYKFGISHYVNGRIVAVNDDLSNWDVDDWRGLQNALVSTGRDIRAQIGASTGLVAMPGFAIPGVGEPPVRMFQILIGLFLLLAGPVMLIVLKRTEQMQYLFVAVPMLSLAVCLSLFLYAVLVDGSNRWGRTQTVTTMDHRTNMSVTHSRTNYYTGGNPGRYTFPADTLSMVATNEVANPMFVRFEAGKQEVWGGDIRPRMPHEVVSIRSQPSRQRLILIPPDTNSAGAMPAVKNQLGADVALVVFRFDEKLFMVENLAADATSVADRIDASVAQNKSSTQIKERAPYLVSGISGYANSRQYRYSVPTNNGLDSWGEDARVIELIRSNRISELLTTPGTYVAIMEQFPLAAEQIEPVDYKLQVHVVQGQW
jgi:hypothetical protein